MTSLLLIWLGLLFALIFFAIGKPGTTGALTLSYFLALSLIHVPGAALFITPNPYLSDFRETEAGFEMTVIGLAAFVAGAAFARFCCRDLLAIPAAESRVAKLEPHIWRMLAVGVIAYFVIMPRADAIPSGTALISSMGSLMIIALWLRFYTASQMRQRSKSLTTLMMVPLLPVASLVGAGFLNYGTTWALCCIAFLFVITRWRIVFYILSPTAGVFGASLFTTYIAGRADLRTSFAYQPGLLDRFTQFSSLLGRFQLLDFSSPLVSLALDARLNQNNLDGLGVERYLAGAANLAYGSTIQLWTLIPRVIWPDKPQVGGGGDLVSSFTGLPFQVGTSVGAGQVLEFYMNFAVPGVLIGFFIWGALLMRLDCGVFAALKRGDMRGILLYAMPGLALIQPDGNLVTILVAFVGSMVMSRALIRLGWFGTSTERSSPVAVVQPAE